MKQQTSRAINITRGMAVLGVIWGHSIYGFKYPLELNGAFWVWIFFAISGYLIASNIFYRSYDFSADGLKYFLWNRFLRIVPLYEIALFMGLMIEFSSGLKKTPLNEALFQFFFLSPLNSTTLAGPLWAVCVVIKFYIFSIPIAYIISKIPPRLSVMLPLWLVSVLTAGLYIAFTHDNFVQPRTFVGNIHYFMFGVILAKMYGSKIFLIPRLLRYSLICILVAVAWYFNNWCLKCFWSGGASICALLISFVILCTEGKKDENLILRWKPFYSFLNLLSWCGFYSYGIYVYHSVIVKANQAYFHFPPGIRILILLLIALPFAVLSYNLIEKPLIKLRKGEKQTYYANVKKI